MRRTLALTFAMLIVIASAVVGLAILRTDVTVDVTGPYDSMECGAALPVALDGYAQGGGEVRRPDAVCSAAARDQVLWAAIPAATGLLAVGYLGVRWIAVVREAKAQGRSRGAVTT